MAPYAGVQKSVHAGKMALAVPHHSREHAGHEHYYALVFLAPGVPHRLAPVSQHGVPLLTGPRLHDIQDGHRSNVQRWHESRPGLRSLGQEHVYVLYLSAGIAPLTGEVEADQCECCADWSRVFPNVL